MQRVALKDNFEAIPVERRLPSAGTLEGAPHPMHQHLLARWSETPAVETKYAPRTRFLVAIGVALAAWGLVGAIVWGIAALI